MRNIVAFCSKFTIGINALRKGEERPIGGHAVQKADPSLGMKGGRSVDNPN